MQTEPAPTANHAGDLSPSARLLLLALAIFLLGAGSEVIANLALQSAHFFEWFYGLEQVEAAGRAGGELIPTRLTLWSAALAFPIWAAGVGFLVRRLKAVPAVDIGLTLHGCWKNVLLGCGAAAVLTPLVLGLNVGAAYLFETTLGFAPTEHPLSAAGKQGLLPVEWVLLAFLVMVSAPVREELLFRGVLQRLFAQHNWASHVAMALALLTALVSSILSVTRQPPRQGPTPNGLSLLSAFMPVVFIGTMAPVYAALCWRNKVFGESAAFAPSYPDIERPGCGTTKAPQAPAVFATALLFAATHSFAWPTPIALFVLGLGLGYLALRTRSLVAPVVVHCLFNGVSYVLLVTGAPL
jgi:membrane protease YdiL (CAAX protease family)